MPASFRNGYSVAAPSARPQKDGRRVETMIPTGNVTFIFTDIEGSTVRWDTDREAMQTAVRRHDALLRDALEQHGGYVFKTIGDAFCVAFQTAPQALRGALEAQRALASEDWGAVNGLRVRMAIHGGETDERDGDYFGPAVNRVARLLSTGHGGQVLVSGLVADSVTDSLPHGVTLRHLGVVPLKDLKDPERVYQLVAPDLLSEFKALRLLETPPNNVPPLTSSTIGRERDIAMVKDLLHTSRVVTIVGTGGVGKTRVAVHVMTDVLNDTGEGAWFVDLAPIADASLVASTILSTLGADQNGDGTMTDVLINHLRSRRLLLYLDNCEHVVHEVARVAEAIAKQCPHVTILSSSREALHIPGEALHHLQPLPVTDAIRLFAERAKAVHASFAVTDENRESIEALCKHLDGIALAIELAAVRTRVMSVSQIAGHLNERFRMLTGGSRTALPKQQTLRAMIDWSYDVLEEPEKAMLRRVSIFAGGWTIERATDVCGGDGVDAWDVVDILTSLTDKSLLVLEGDELHRRFTLLESIREYGRDKLTETDELTRIALRHAHVSGEVAHQAYREWDTAPGPNWLSDLADELDNFRSALTLLLSDDSLAETGGQLAGDLAPMFMRLSLLREGVQWCELALKHPLNAVTEARLRNGLSSLRNNQNEPKAALQEAERAVVLFRLGDDDRGLTRALSQIAQLYGRLMRSLEAEEPAAEAVSRARSIGDERLLATVLQRCGMIFPPERIAEARAYFTESVSLFRKLGRDDEVSRALTWWSIQEGEAGCDAEARDLATRALEIAAEDSRLMLEMNITLYSLLLKEEDIARTHGREALTLTFEAKHAVMLPAAVSYAARLIYPIDPAASARLFGYAMARLSETEWTPSFAEARLLDEFEERIRVGVDASDLGSLLDAGASMSDDDAVSRAFALL